MFLFFPHFLFVFENSLKHSGWIYNNVYSISEIEIYFCYSDQLFVYTWFQDLDQEFRNIEFHIPVLMLQYEIPVLKKTQSFVASQAPTSLFSVWNGMEGSITLDVRLTCRFWAEFFSFLVDPLENFITFEVKSCSSFFELIADFPERLGVRFQFLVFVEAWASTCA